MGKTISTTTAARVRRSSFGDGVTSRTGGKAEGRVSGATVTIRRAEYERLLAKAGEAVEGDGPPLPKPDARGHVPAVEYLRASIARELIRDRKAAGLSQSELGELAGVRQETISRIESGKHTVSVRVMESIERALLSRRATTEKRKPGNGATRTRAQTKRVEGGDGSGARTR